MSRHLADHRVGAGVEPRQIELGVSPGAMSGVARSVPWIEKSCSTVPVLTISSPPDCDAEIISGVIENSVSVTCGSQSGTACWCATAVIRLVDRTDAKADGDGAREQRDSGEAPDEQGPPVVAALSGLDQFLEAFDLEALDIEALDMDLGSSVEMLMGLLRG